jgi:hypothetical protein
MLFLGVLMLLFGVIIALIPKCQVKRGKLQYCFPYVTVGVIFVLVSVLIIMYEIFPGLF